MMSTAVDPRSAEALREHDEVGESAPSGAMKAAGGFAGWLDDRTGGAGFMSYLLKKTFPDHWTFMLGEIAMYTLIICLLTGTFLTFWFVPSAGQVVYDGSYLPLQGVTMSEAYRSTVDESVVVENLSATSTGMNVQVSFVSNQDSTDAPADLRAQRICWSSSWPLLQAGGELRIGIPARGATSKRAC